MQSDFLEKWSSYPTTGVRQYLHRMVVCLDSEILPFVPIAMERLMKHADAKELYDFIPLINQLVCKFKVSSLSTAIKKNNKKENQ